MMTNLFSIFDPSTPNFMSTNWVSMLMMLFLPLTPLWFYQNRLSKLLANLKYYIFSEFKPLIKKSPYTLMLSLSFFIFIMMNNLMGLMSYIFTASSHLSFTLSLALPAWMALMLFSWSMNTSNTLAHLIPQGTPFILMPFMVLIESISNLIRPGTLAVRLMANMVAGHLLLVLLSSSFINSSLPMMTVILMPQLALSILELAVAFIQAYVFSVLISLYMAEATN